MSCYWDTSALVKLLVREADTDRAIRLVTTNVAHKSLAIWRVEAESALARKLRSREMTGEEAGAARVEIRRLFHHIESVPLSDSCVNLASVYPGKYGLRSLDSLHLAAAVVCAGEEEGDFSFIVADSRLVSAARREGLVVVGLA
jgi:predicted nucleic acid-binding protein